jgi:single-stranded DNA-specific DHH superfamily exonuclease
LISAEKQRRSEAERAIEERQREEREWKKEVERQRAEEERVLREEVVEAVREGLLTEDGCVSLVDLAWSVGKDLVWVERLVRASGVLGQVSKKEEGVVAMITGEGWTVILDSRLLQKAYAETAAFGNGRDGKVSFQEFGGILEKCVRERTKA